MKILKFYKIRNNIVIKGFKDVGVYVSSDTLFIPIFTFTAMLKFLIFSGILDYKTIQQVINEYKETQELMERK